MDNKQQEIIFETMKEAILQGGKVLMKYFKRGVHMDFKEKSSQADILTIADKESQNIIQKTIMDLLVKNGFDPDTIGFIGEEQLNKQGSHLFIIDPLDGTTNFAYGCEVFSISIGYLFNNEIQIGMIYEPFYQRLYYALKDKGAYMLHNDKLNKLSIHPYDLKNSIILATLNFESYDSLIQIYNELIPKVKAARWFGSIASELCYLTENIVNILVNGNCYCWDIAAADLILKESGGGIYYWNGESWKPDLANPTKPQKIFVCHSNMRNELIKITSKYYG